MQTEVGDYAQAVDHERICLASLLLRGPRFVDCVLIVLSFSRDLLLLPRFFRFLLFFCLLLLSLLFLTQPLMHRFSALILYVLCALCGKFRRRHLDDIVVLLVGFFKPETILSVLMVMMLLATAKPSA